DEGITEESEAEEVKYSNLEIVEHFDIENIVYLSDEIFQDGEYDTDNLAADLIREWGYDNEDNGLSRTDQYINNNSNTVDEEDASENLSVKNDSINLEPLPIALRKT
ncbi:22540_t:CDS:2, partial [Racocetra persica]